MPKLTLYHAAPSRSSIVHWMLEELGQPYDIHLVSFKKGENLKPDYLAVNPMGKVPSLKHGDTVITEAAAICAYLADEFPQAKLNVPVGDPRRGVYLKWLFYGPSCVEPAIMDGAFPRKEPPPRGALGYGSIETVLDVLTTATAAARPVSPGRTIHRRRRRHRLGSALGHDVQADSRAAGVHGLRRPARRTPRAQARHREGYEAAEGAGEGRLIPASR